MPPPPPPLSPKYTLHAFHVKISCSVIKHINVYNMMLTRSTSCCCLNMERVFLIAVAVVVTGPVIGLVLPVHLSEPLILPPHPLQARIYRVRKKAFLSSWEIMYKPEREAGWVEGGGAAQKGIKRRTGQDFFKPLALALAGWFMYTYCQLHCTVQTQRSWNHPSPFLQLP